jgi:hypothetical protein
MKDRRTDRLRRTDYDGLFFYRYDKLVPVLLPVWKFGSCNYVGMTSLHVLARRASPKRSLAKRAAVLVLPSDTTFNVFVTPTSRPTCRLYLVGVLDDHVLMDRPSSIRLLGLARSLSLSSRKPTEARSRTVVIVVHNHKQESLFPLWSFFASKGMSTRFFPFFLSRTDLHLPSNSNTIHPTKPPCERTTTRTKDSMWVEERRPSSFSSPFSLQGEENARLLFDFFAF